VNENKNQRLAREITDFCKERLKSPSVKSKGAKSLLQTALASFLALAFTSGGVGPNRGSTW
jgi:hypothetical protein